MAYFPLLLEPEQLAAALPLASNILIIEQASLANYQTGHIPGSVWLDFKQLQAATPPMGFLPSKEHLEQLFSQLGIQPDTHIICSDDEGGGWAGRLSWILDSIGHSHYSLLNGGLTAWRQAGLPLSQTEPAHQASHYRIKQFNTEVSASQEYILSRLGQADFAIWDARSFAEYTGEKSLATRAGHIPGAQHYEWTQAMDKERGLKLRSLAIIEQELKQLGLTKDKEIATHCQTHHRSGLTYVIGKLLGFNIKGYAGSWSQWGNSSNTPVQIGTQP